MSVVVKEMLPLQIKMLDTDAVPEKFVEIIDGELFHMTPAGRKHNRIALNFIWLFKKFCDGKSSLSYGSDNEGFLLQAEPVTMISPDACLFRKRPETGNTWLEFSPEIAVEVLSPSNAPAEMLFKRKLYFEAGSEQVWIANPQTSELVIYLNDMRMITASGDETFIGEGIAEEMQINLPELFKVD